MNGILCRHLRGPPQPCEAKGWSFVNAARKYKEGTMRKRVWLYNVLAAVLVISTAGPGRAADVKPKDVITKENMATYSDLISPTVKFLLEQGLKIEVADPVYKKIEWPKLYKE